MQKRNAPIIAATLVLAGCAVPTLDDGGARTKWEVFPRPSLPLLRLVRISPRRGFVPRMAVIGMNTAVRWKTPWFRYARQVATPSALRASPDQPIDASSPRVTHDAPVNFSG